MYRTNLYGFPYFSSIVESLLTLRFGAYPLDCEFYGYVNGDILLDSRIEEVLDVIQSNQKDEQLKKRILLVGRRTNSLTTASLKVESMSDDEYLNYIKLRYIHNEQFMGLAMDYFIFTEHTFGNDFLSDIVIGRDMIDSYILHYCISNENIDVIDCSTACRKWILNIITFIGIAIHQTGEEGNWGNKKSVKSIEDDQWNKKILDQHYGTNITLFKTTYLSNYRISIISIMIILIY